MALPSSRTIRHVLYLSNCIAIQSYIFLHNMAMLNSVIKEYIANVSRCKAIRQDLCQAAYPILGACMPVLAPALPTLPCLLPSKEGHVPACFGVSRFRVYLSKNE